MPSLEEIIHPYLPVIYKGLGLYAVCIVSVAVDLIAGIRKSRKNGVKIIYSYGLRRTLHKLAKYFNLLLAASTLDAGIIISGIPEAHELPMLPYVTTMMAMILCLVEGYSVWEKDEDKGKYLEAARIAKEAVRAVDMDAFTDTLISKLEEKEQQNETENNNNPSNTIGNSNRSKHLSRK